jgi:uncharacterized protein (DUF1330 family)
MTLIVILTVRPEALDTFRAFEQQAARLMARHGGAIERVVVLARAAPDAPPDLPPDAPHREVHLVTFPSAEAYAAYRADPGLQALAPLREAAVLSTEILAGEEGPHYGG